MKKYVLGGKYVRKLNVLEKSISIPQEEIILWFKG